MLHRSAPRPRTRRPLTVSVGALLALLTACTSTAAPATTTSPTTAPSTSGPANGGGWLGVDAGPQPNDVDKLLAQLGTIDAACDSIPFAGDEIQLYVGAGARGRKTEIEQLLTTALESAGIKTNLKGVLGEDTGVDSRAGRPVFRVPAAGDISIKAINRVNEELAKPFGGQVLVDVDHIGPFLPVGTFHPATPPEEATAAPSARGTGAGAHTVLVVDSPAPSDRDLATPATPSVTGAKPTGYDTWGEQWSTPPNTGADRKVDFVAGHGPFVVDLIRREAPGATVELSPLVHRPDADNWPGFLFAESDLIAAIELGLGSDATADFATPRHFTRHVDLLNMSLGLFGCAGDRHPVLAAELADVITATSYAKGVEGVEQPTLIVAAAGNDAKDIRHYPAAFADPAAGGAALAKQVVSVGGLDPTDATRPACTSNTGSWVLAWASNVAIAAFPPVFTNRTGFATWAGTSFATAHVTAALADAAGSPAATWSAAESAKGRIGTAPDAVAAAPTSPAKPC